MLPHRFLSGGGIALLKRPEHSLNLSKSCLKAGWRSSPATTNPEHFINHVGQNTADKRIIARLIHRGVKLQVQIEIFLQPFLMAAFSISGKRVAQSLQFCVADAACGSTSHIRLEHHPRFKNFGNLQIT